MFIVKKITRFVIRSYIVTCIAVLKNKNGRLVMCGDRRATSGDFYQKTVTSKVINKDGILLGFCGELHLASLVIDSVNFPEKPNNMSGLTYINHKIIPLLFRLLENTRYLAKGASNVNSEGTSIIVGLKGELYHISIEKDSGIIAWQENLPNAFGSGGDYAISVLTYTEGSGKTCRQRLIEAQEVVAKLCCSCGDGWDIISED